MDIGSVVLLGNELVLRRRVDAIAHNVANVNTSGFKRAQTLAATVSRDMADVRPEHRSVKQVLDFGVAADPSDGPFQPTGNPLDVAIRGSGMFAVRLADGTTAYTRAGAMRLSADGVLEVAGGSVLGADGGEIRIPPEAAARASVSADGTVVAAGEVVGTLAVHRGDARLASPAGDGLVTWSATQTVPPVEVRLQPGGLEGSNVIAVVESAALIQATRAYQATQKMSGDLADLGRRSVERLGRNQY